MQAIRAAREDDAPRTIRGTDRHGVGRSWVFRFAVSLLVPGLSATTWVGASFAESSSMKETAADRMMPRDQAQKMRVCRQLAKEQKIKLQDRFAFIENCMVK